MGKRQESALWFAQQFSSSPIRRLQTALYDRKEYRRWSSTGKPLSLKRRSVDSSSSSPSSGLPDWSSSSAICTLILTISFGSATARNCSRSSATLSALRNGLCIGSASRLILRRSAAIRRVLEESG